MYMYDNSACSVADGCTRRQMNTIEIVWSVKSYHYFKVKPNPGEVMQVRREYNNPVDPNAMSVLREGGEQVGRVPANLC